MIFYQFDIYRNYSNLHNQIILNRISSQPNCSECQLDQKEPYNKSNQEFCYDRVVGFFFDMPIRC